MSLAKCLVGSNSTQNILSRSQIVHAPTDLMFTLNRASSGDVCIFRVVPKPQCKHFFLLCCLFRCTLNFCLASSLCLIAAGHQTIPSTITSLR
jgi:hypothetical protein